VRRDDGDHTSTVSSAMVGAICVRVAHRDPPPALRPFRSYGDVTTPPVVPVSFVPNGTVPTLGP
jgi:hypothetical protein